MPHKHIVYDADPHFSINPDTRVLTYASPEKLTIMQGDHNSEVFTFDIPRYVDGHDMLECNRVEVHYLNIDGNKSASRVSGVYEIDDLQINPSSASDDNLVCSWLISGNATQYAGPLNFVLRFSCVTTSENSEGNTVADVVYVWNTAIFQGVTVTNSLNNSEEIAEDYADILTNWYYELMNSANSGLNVVDSAAKEAAERLKNIARITNDLGDSEELVVSQKGITDSISELHTRLAFNEYDGPYSEGLTIGVYNNYDDDKTETIAIVEGIGTCTDTDLCIPPSYNGYIVKYIALNAFRNNTNITSIRIPETIVFISRSTEYGGPMSAATLSEVISWDNYESSYQANLGAIYIEYIAEIASRFWSCNNLAAAVRFYFGPGISKIAANAFSGGNNGYDTYDFTKAARVPTIESSSFGYISNIAPADTFKIPDNLYTEWIASNYWLSLTEYISPVEVTNKVLNTDDIVNELGVDKTKSASQDLVNAVVNAVTSKNTERGSAVRLNGLLPIKQNIDVKLQSKNLWQVTTPFGNVSYEADEQVLVISGASNVTLHKLATPIPKGTTVTITAKVLSGTVTSGGDGGLAFGGYNKTGSTSSWQGYINIPKCTNADISGQTYTETATVTADVTHFYVFAYASTATIHSPLRVKVQYEIGDAATEMIPYVDPSEATLIVAGANLIKFPYAETDRTRAGIKYTTDSQGIINYTGTSTGSYFSLATYEGKELYLHKGVSYTFSGMPAGSSMSTAYAHITESDETRHFIAADATTFVAQSSGYAKVTLVVSEGTTVTNKKFAPKLEAIGYSSEFEPYSGQTYTPTDGVCKVLSTPPTMTLFTDNPDVVVEVTHSQDINEVLRDIRVTLDGILARLE